MNDKLRSYFTLLLGLTLIVGNAVPTFAQTQITTINTNAVTTGLTTSTYTATAPSDASGLIVASREYTVNYGQIQNLFVTSYVAGGTTYDNFVLPDTLIIQRTDAGRQLVIFYEYDNVESTGPPYNIDIDAEEEDNEEALYQSGLLNAGYDNILVNTATNFANVERIDIIYNSGVVTSSPSTAVFPIIERGGNDDIKVAAIKALDASGNPSEYYPTVVDVNNNGTSEWGNSGIAHLSLVLRRQDATSDPLPQVTLGSQNIHGSAVSFTDFGVLAGEIVYGYSIMGDDVDVTPVSNIVDHTNATNFPTNTGSASGLDLIAGISTAVSSDVNLVPATGPGGYKAALTTWLKANEDADVTTSTDGSSVTDWQDHALGDHDATTLTTAPTYESDAAADINFNPTVDFVDATERGLQIANNTDFNTATSYATKGFNVAIRTGNDITTKQQIYEQGSNDRGINVYIRAGSLYVGGWNETNDGTGSPWTFNSVSSSSIATDTEYIVTVEFDGNSGETGTVTAYLNGQSIGSFSSVGLLFSDTDGIGIGDTNSQSRYDDGTTAAASFYGSIPEFIYCNEPGSFTTDQRDRIESYLALKYGITLNQSTANNYVNSEGDIIFDTSTAASIGGYLEYNNDIAGIGRDDNSEFLQLQSQSENVNSIVEMNRDNPASIGIDNTWLIWGNDAGATTSSRIVTKPETINERLERVWRVAEEGSMGVTDISFDLTGLGFGTTASDFSLLIASNSSGADFSSATVTTGGTFNGDVITFSDVNLSDGEYFTLGTQFFICTPGNVQDGLSLWLKADAETFNTGTTAATNGQTVETWGDQGRNDFDATNDGGTTNRAPTWVETDVNFNPGLNFPDDAGSNAIGFNLGSNYIFAEDAGAGLHVFSAIEPIDAGTNNSTRQQKMIYSFGNRTVRNVGLGSSDQRGTIQYPGNNVNFNISPNAAAFLVEGDWDISVGTSDTRQFLIDGEVINSVTASFQLDDASIDQAATHGSNQGPVSIGRQSETNNLNNNNGRRFYGDMQEIIVYNEEITDLQAQQVRSYLAIKYGTTLTDDNDNSSTRDVISGSVEEGDYVASDGSTITFDYSEDTGFVTNVAGVGRDDDTCLNQKQSRSVNSDAILTVGLGEIAVNNAANANTFDDDLDFFTWGSDGASTAFGNITTAGTPGTVNERMLRIWRAQDNGTVGATDISFDLTSLPGYSTNAGDYQLIIASGGDNTSLEAGTTITGGTFNGTVLTFDNVNLTDGQYFTLGVSADLCGPGGVTTSMVLWLRADNGTSTTTDNTSLTTWTDQSTAANDGTEATNPPLFKDNTTDNINFLPTIDFDGTNDRLSIGDLSEIKSATGTGNYTMLGVGIRQDANDNYVLGSTGGTNDEELYFGYTSANTTATLDHENNAINLTSLSAFDSPAQTPFLLFGEYDGSGRIFEELRDDNFNRNTDSNTTDISGTQTNYIGDVTNTGNYNGLISEVLVYNAAITDLEKLRIYSYFSIKYGITLPQDNNNNAILNENISGSVDEGDLVASDGTTIIWDESNSNATYHNGMAGIGRDDDACLNQKQSTSSTDGTILTMGLGSVAADNAANSGIHDNLDFLVWGHDDGATAQASANTADLPSTVSERMTRVWRVEDIGTVGATEIQFDLTGLGYGTDASDFRLIISNSPTMASGSLTTGGTFNGSVLSFSGVDLTDGQYFTLGTALTTCGPGGVNTNIALWLRADLEVFSDAGTTPATDADNVQQWNDQSSPADNASEVDGGGGSPVEPTFETNEFNFNPALLITDQNTTNNSYMETTSNTVSGDMTLITVFNTAQNQGSTTDFSNAPALIGANSGGTNDYGLGMSLGQLHFNAADNSSLNARSTGTYNDGEPYIATGTRVQAASGAINLYANSASVATGTSDNVALSGPTTFGIGNHSTYTNGGQFQGDIAEALVFSSVLTGNERARVETYLAIKYGITRDVALLAAADQDYLAGDGGIVWDYDLQGTTYHNDIAGIGRDDLSCFEQAHSKSENNDAIVDVSIASFTDDDSWFIWGNDNAAIEAPGNKERPASIASRLNREWRVQETGTIGTVSITFDLSTITGTPLGDNNLNQVRLMVDDDGDFATGPTLTAPTSINSIDKTVTFDVNLTTGQYFTLGSIEVDALPITLISFDATVTQNNQVLVKWTTAQEIGNALFTIERSRNGIEFEAIAFKEGAGDSDAILEYELIDFTPLEGTSFYRLAQTDFNGDMSYSHLSRILISPSLERNLKLVPNPVTQGQDFTLKYQVTEEQNVRVLVFDSNGKMKLNTTHVVKPNDYEITISTTYLTKGLYLVKTLSQGLKSRTLKLIVR